VRQGMAANLVVFDPEAVQRHSGCYSAAKVLLVFPIVVPSRNPSSKPSETPTYRGAGSGETRSITTRSFAGTSCPLPEKS
jgi:hypothetical protein